MRIMCLTPGTWKVWSDEMVKHGRDYAVLSSAYPVYGSASDNHSEVDAQVVSCHHYLVIFVEQLTVFL